MDHMVALQNNDVLSGNDYPPYDIVKTGEDEYSIELAVAGFKKDELNIEVKDQYLTIKGDSSSRHSNEEYIHKNIARRSFIRRFSLAENVKVNEAKMEDGVLVVALTHDIPEEQKPKSITIQ
jgi:molecular chaperone IbpA